MFSVPRSDAALATDGLLLCSLLAVVWLSLGAPAPARAASPDPSAPPVLIDPLDPRGGDGASTVGAPLLALLVVIGSGVLAAGTTYIYVRMTRSRTGRP